MNKTIANGPERSQLKYILKYIVRAGETPKIHSLAEAHILHKVFMNYSIENI